MASVLSPGGADSPSESTRDRSPAPPLNRSVASLESTANDPDCSDSETSGEKIRILVTGRASAGKATLLKNICRSPPADPTLQLEVPHERYIFHYSPGFEGARDARLSDVKNFISSKTATCTFAEQLHVIWYCFRTDTNVYMSPGDEHFFSENIAQNVPVIVVFTKYDSLVTLAFGDLRRTMGRLEAKEKRFERAQEFLQLRYIDRLNSFPFPPAAFVRLDDIWSDNLNTDALFQTTLEITSGERLAPIRRTIRRNNMDSCLEDAVTLALVFRADSAHEFLFPLLQLFPHVWMAWDYERPYGRNSSGPFVSRQTFAHCITMFDEKLPLEIIWTNARRAEAIAAACICIEQTYMEAAAGPSDFVAAFQSALDVYFSEEHTPRSVINRAIANFSPQDYHDAVDPSSTEGFPVKKVAPKLLELIKTHRLRLLHEPPPAPADE